MTYPTARKPVDGDYSTLESRVKFINTINRWLCRDCGNAWWFDMPQSYVCTTCAKTHGKRELEERNWKPKEIK